jgi:outer membrane biosynthesis protein TonB
VKKREEQEKKDKKKREEEDKKEKKKKEEEEKKEKKRKEEEEKKEKKRKEEEEKKQKKEEEKRQKEAKKNAASPSSSSASSSSSSSSSSQTAAKCLEEPNNKELIDALKQAADPSLWPSGCDSKEREQSLPTNCFAAIFSMDKAAFAKLPEWKRSQLRREKGFF